MRLILIRHQTGIIIYNFRGNIKIQAFPANYTPSSDLIMSLWDFDDLYTKNPAALT